MAVKHEPRSVRSFHPRWPDKRAIDPERVALDYWSDVDTHMVEFRGRSRPAVSVPLNLGGNRDFVYLRIDPSTEEVVGLQIEDVVAYAVRERPLLLDALGEAELHGTTTEDVLAVPARPHFGPEGRRALIEGLFDAFAGAPTAS